MITLRPYQIDIAAKGLAILQSYGILYLGMEVRTGKSITALSIAAQYQATSVLFLTKKKAIASIEHDAMMLEPSYKFTCTNYEQAPKLNPSEYDFVIVDEAQNCGKYPSPAQRQKTIRKIVGSKPLILLSGTPSPESYSQLFHQLTLSHRSPWENYYHDKRQGSLYAFYRWARAGYVTITKKRIGNTQEIFDYSQADGDKIWKDIKHLFILFSQQQAGFNASVDEYFLTVEMSDTCRKVYREIEKERIYIYQREGHADAVAQAESGAELINKLAQIASGTLIYDDEPKGRIIDQSKALFISREFANRKIAVFYRFKAELELLKAFFPKWTDSPEVFNGADDYTFLGQIQSAREGVNLSSADALVAYNIDFSATSYFQMKARGQSKDRVTQCPIYWIFSQFGIEAKIYQAVSNKKNFTFSYYQRVSKEEKRMAKIFDAAFSNV